MHLLIFFSALVDTASPKAFEKAPSEEMKENRSSVPSELSITGVVSVSLSQAQRMNTAKNAIKIVFIVFIVFKIKLLIDINLYVLFFLSVTVKRLYNQNKK